MQVFHVENTRLSIEFSNHNFGAKSYSTKRFSW